MLKLDVYPLCWFYLGCYVILNNEMIFEIELFWYGEAIKRAVLYISPSLLCISLVVNVDPNSVAYYKM